MESMKIKGIDVSHWQGAIDWAKVKQDGVEFAIVKATQGTDIKDSCFERNYAGAKAAGVQVGVYHFLTARSVIAAEKEAVYFLNAIDGKQFEYPVAVDIEDLPKQTNLSGLGMKTLTDICIVFMKLIEAAGYRVMLYTGTNFRRNYVDISRLDSYPLWQAHYPYKDETNLDKIYAAKPSAIDGRVHIWQASDKGRVAGIAGDVDMNWAFADLSQPVTAVPTPEPVKPSVPTQTQTPTAIVKGDTVRVNRGAKSYEGVSMKSFVYDRTYRVDELKGNRAVLDRSGLCTAFNVNDLTRV